MHYAKEKAKSVKNKIKENALIIGFDTIIFFQNKIIGKPEDKKEALNILIRLNNNVHSVYTGIACLKDDFVMVDYESAKVRFNNIPGEKWKEYIENNSVLDKAGAYGIQDLPVGYAVVIEGRIETVIGIPIEKLKQCLERMGLWNLRQ